MGAHTHCDAVCEGGPGTSGESNALFTGLEEAWATTAVGPGFATLEGGAGLPATTTSQSSSRGSSDTVEPQLHGWRKRVSVASNIAFVGMSWARPAPISQFDDPAVNTAVAATHSTRDPPSDMPTTAMAATYLNRWGGGGWGRRRGPAGAHRRTRWPSRMPGEAGPGRVVAGLRPAGVSQKSAVGPPAASPGREPVAAMQPSSTGRGGCEHPVCEEGHRGGRLPAPRKGRDGGGPGQLRHGPRIRWPGVGSPRRR